MSDPAVSPAPPGGHERSASSARRQLTAAVLGGAAAGGLALFAGGQRWAEVTAVRRPPLPPVSGALTGAAAAPLVPATGLLLLAAAVALVAVRGLPRRVLGLVIAVAGGVLAWSALGALTGRLDVAAARLPVLGGAPAGARTDLAPGWPVLVVVAGALAVGVGLLVVLRGRRWPAMGRRYQRPGDPAGAGRTVAGPGAPAREPTDEERAQAAWRALDRGEDPTEPASDAPDHRVH